MTERKSGRLTARDIALVGVMVAVIEACKFALLEIPNVELTTFWIIMFTLYFKKRVFFVIPVFIAIEGAVFGFGLWWIMYLYVWPLLALVTLALSKKMDAIVAAAVSCFFGLSFGLLCAIPYLFLGTDTKSGFETAFTWWIAGIPWDIAHGIANLVIMLVLYRPVTSVMKRISKQRQ